MTIEIDNVELYFAHKKILSGIYLKAESGKLTAIIGSNGCGKSSLLKIIFGDLIPKYKSLRIDGCLYLKPLFRSGFIKYLPQSTMIPNGIKLKSAFHLFGLDIEGFRAIFESFHFQNNVQIQCLSGGERRLVEIYLILKCESKIVLLDEPFTHLSPIYIDIVKNLILQEKKHKIIILTDHLYDEVLDISDDLYLIKNGCSKLINNKKDLEFEKYLYREEPI